MLARNPSLLFHLGNQVDGEFPIAPLLVSTVRTTRENSCTQTWRSPATGSSIWTVLSVTVQQWRHAPRLTPWVLVSQRDHHGSEVNCCFVECVPPSCSSKNTPCLHRLNGITDESTRLQFSRVSCTSHFEVWFWRPSVCCLRAFERDVCHKISVKL